MNFSNNTFNNTREISGFSKDEVLEIKKTLAKLIAQDDTETEINTYISSKLHISSELLDKYSTYLKEINNFTETYLLSNTDKGYFYLKTEILDELRVITDNLQNLSSNTRNIKRITKNYATLDDSLKVIDDLLMEYTHLSSKIQQSVKEIKSIEEDKTKLWTEINRIKNLNFKLNNIPDNLGKWDDIKELVIFINSLNEVFLSKRKRDKSEKILTFHFDDIYQYFVSKEDKKINFYSDLIYLLFLNRIYEMYQGEEFINVLERKEVIQKLKDFLNPLLKEQIKDNIYDILSEIEDFDIKEKDLSINLDTLKDQKISEFLPKVVDYYINGLEKGFQEKIQNVMDADKFEEIANFYYQKIDSFSSTFYDIEDWVLRIETLLTPYERITAGLRKIFSNLTSEIFRRKNEYLSFIKTVRDEELRVGIRKFVSEKIAIVNDLISSYEDETSLILKEEFPQLKRINEILSDYNQKIQKIKDDVYKHLNSVKTNDVDIYQVIKFWEESLNRKKQQLTFLISLLINKLFKSFKELIEKEGILFATITEITEQTEKFEGLPLNFALSSFLAEKLSEEELRERISEIQSKINQLSNSLGLYQVELSKLETILANRVKIRKGISRSEVQCTVCHKYIDFAKNKVITCPFCASTYHYLCVAFWLSKYNSCPMCQNHFLEPHSQLFENEEDHELERY